MPQNETDGRANGAGREHPTDVLLGARIRQVRTERGFRLRELAARADQSESVLSRIENDKATPSLVALRRIAQALDTNLSSLFGETEPADDEVVLRRGERHVIRLTSEKISMESLVPFGRSYLLQGFLVTVAPGGQNQATRQHQGEELGFVLEGELELTVGSTVHRLRTGDSFNFRSERPHALKNVGEGVLKLLWVNTPPTL